MPRVYPWNEAIVRIYRKLRGDTIDPDVMELDGSVTFDEAVAGLAEIMQESGTESLTLPGMSFSGDIGVAGGFVVSGTIYAEDLVSQDDLIVIDDGFIGGDLVVSGTATVEDLITQDDLTVNDDGFIGGDLVVTGTATSEDLVSRDTLNVGTGTFYAGASRISVGGFSTATLFGNGSIVQGFGPASVRPTGTLAHLGGVLWSEEGNLMWLGSSGTVTTVAGS